MMEGPDIATTDAAYPARTRGLLPPIVLAAGATVAGWLAVGILLGILAGLGLPRTITTLGFVLSPVPAFIGARIGAGRAARVLDDRLSRAALGVTGALVPVALSGFAVLAGLDQAIVTATIAMPVLGSLVGGLTGGGVRGHERG